MTGRYTSLLGLALCAVLAGCSGGGDAADTTSGSAADTPAAKLAQLEDAGAIPKLDRSDSLAGPDADNNGIRDDIDAYIAQQPYAAEPQKRAAVQQMARAMQQNILVDTTDMIAVMAVNRLRANAIHCLFLRFDEKRGDPYPAKVSKEIVSITTNTKQRLLAYLALSKALDGKVWSSNTGDTCDE